MDGMSDCMVSFNRCEKEMVSRMEKTVPPAAFFAMLSCCSSIGCSIVKGALVKVRAIRLRIGNNEVIHLNLSHNCIVDCRSDLQEQFPFVNTAIPIGTILCVKLMYL